MVLTGRPRTGRLLRLPDPERKGSITKSLARKSRREVGRIGGSRVSFSALEGCLGCFFRAAALVAAIAFGPSCNRPTDDTVLLSSRALTEPPASGLQIWYKADVGVTSSAGKVSAWADQSGNGRNATQGTSTAQPSLVVDALNGKPVISFNGTSNFMNFTYAVNGLSGMTIVMVANNTNSAQTGGTWHSDHAAIFWPQTAQWGIVYLSPFQSSVKFRFGTGQNNNLPSYTRPSSIGAAYTTSISIKNGTTDSRT
jgi:hypothetical protein